MLIENVEQELDPLLDPVLERRFLRKGRQVTVQLADKEVRQHESSQVHRCVPQTRVVVMPYVVSTHCKHAKACICLRSLPVQRVGGAEALGRSLLKHPQDLQH